MTDRLCRVLDAVPALYGTALSDALRGCCPPAPEYSEFDLIATQTFALVKQLIRTPGHENLIPIYEDMRNIRREERRKKRVPKLASEE